MEQSVLFICSVTHRTKMSRENAFKKKTKQRVKTRENYDLVQVKKMRKKVMYVGIIL